MPFVLSFCEVHPLAFDGVRDDARWLIGISGRLDAFQGRNDLREVMPVDFNAAPPQLFEYAAQVDARPRVAPVAAMNLIDRKHPAELLQAIPVEDRGQITQLVSRGDV